MVSLLAELRGHERQAAEELERWKTGAEERKPLDASPTAITLALLPTDEELDSLEKRAGDGEIAGRGRTGGSDVASPQPAVRHGEPGGPEQCQFMKKRIHAACGDHKSSPTKKACVLLEPRAHS